MSVYEPRIEASGWDHYPYRMLEETRRSAIEHRRASLAGTLDAQLDALNRGLGEFADVFEVAARRLFGDETFVETRDRMRLERGEILQYELSQERRKRAKRVAPPPMRLRPAALSYRERCTSCGGLGFTTMMDGRSGSTVVEREICITCNGHGTKSGRPRRMVLR